MAAGPFAIGGNVWPGTAKTIEECGELAQVLGKLIATGGHRLHWDGSDLRQRLIEELGDVHAAVTFFAAVNGLDMAAISDRSAAKVELFWKWQTEQHDCEHPEVRECDGQTFCNTCGWTGLILTPEEAIAFRAAEALDAGRG